MKKTIVMSIKKPSKEKKKIILLKEATKLVIASVKKKEKPEIFSNLATFKPKCGMLKKCSCFKITKRPQTSPSPIIKV